MDFSGRVVLAFIEEDNIQRSYFRIRPLLTDEGPISKADIDALPDEGYLRIVPDKNEQHTFKERMRALGSLCVLDLQNLPPDTVKIRNNKNYAPQRGENNQYIVYSDAVQAVPQQVFYEVISAEPGDKEKIAKSATPLCYLRSGGKIYGPVSRATAVEQEGASPLAPDSKGIYAVTLPEGSEKLFYWPASMRALPAVNATSSADDADEGTPHEQPARLNGMPLYQTVARRPVVQQRAHNPLTDTVDQLRATHLEAPGAQVAPGVAMRPVETPMDTFKRSLGALWAMPDMQQQAAAHFLSMTGVQNILNKQLAGAGTDAVAAAMNSQIQDLEAERLALLMQLEASRRDMNQVRQEALSQVTAEEKETLSRLKDAEAAARMDLEQTQAARAKLLAQRDEIVSEMEKAGDERHHLAAAIGGSADLTMLCERMQKSLESGGIACDHDTAVRILSLLAINGSYIELCAPTEADNTEAARKIALALGAPWVYNDGSGVRLEQGGDTFRFIVTQYPDVLRPGTTQLLTGARANSITAYTAFVWPRLYLSAKRGWRFDESGAFPPIKVDAVRAAVMRDAVTPSADALKLMDELDNVLTKAGKPLPQAVRKAIYLYLSATAAKLQGGIARAMDDAVCAWVLPYARENKVNCKALRPLLAALPHALALLEG